MEVGRRINRAGSGPDFVLRWLQEESDYVRRNSIFQRNPNIMFLHLWIFCWSQPKPIINTILDIFPYLVNSDVNYLHLVQVIPCIPKLVA